MGDFRGILTFRRVEYLAHPAIQRDVWIVAIGPVTIVESDPREGGETRRSQE